MMRADLAGRCLLVPEELNKIQGSPREIGPPLPVPPRQKYLDFETRETGRGARGGLSD